MNKRILGLATILFIAPALAVVTLGPDARAATAKAKKGDAKSKPASLPAAAKEEDAPPSDNTTLKFQKSLFVHKSEKGKVFAETRKIAPGDSLKKILEEEYGVGEDVVAPLTEAFKEINPGSDPENLAPGTVVRVPFKLESELAPQPKRALLNEPPPRYKVKRGDSLWMILKNLYNVKREDMPKVIASVMAANPSIKNVNLLYVGQVVNIPADLLSQAATDTSAQAAAETETKPQVPAQLISILNLLESMGCRVDRAGETFIPVERGKTVRLSAEDFPIVAGPSGKKIVFDSLGKLTPALRETLKNSWGYTTVSATSADPAEYLSEIIPELGFFEAAPGPRSIPLREGGMLTARTLWSVIPTQKDLWDGSFHLLFPKGVGVDPDLAGLAREKGFITHLIGTSLEEGKPSDEPLPPLPVLDFSDPLKEAASFLTMLGIDAKLDEEVECRLEAGVTYKIRAPLSFTHLNLNYAVPPDTPARAESLLLRAGYFTFSLGRDTRPVDRVRDLLMLLGVNHRVEEVAAPSNGGFMAHIEGLVVESGDLAKALYPNGGGKGSVLLLNALPDKRISAALIRAGAQPAVLK